MISREIFFPLKDKLHMFAPACNILYIRRFMIIVRNIMAMMSDAIVIVDWLTDHIIHTNKDLLKRVK